MKRINEQRPKAFIGTAISVGTSIVSGIIGNRKKKKAEQAERLRQERLQNLQDNQALASAQNENMMSEEERSQFLSQYLSNGGKVRIFPHKGTELRIVEGGTAIPIKKDSFLLKGRKHNTGGIIIGKGKNSIEAEGDEVVQITPKQLKVFSAQPILNGNSPAELVQKGAEPSKVFNAQESFKDRNGLNDDGTKKKRNMRTITGKKKLGGLSRKKDYGSDKKPYPNVKSNDFAGGGRSYPIPTKADARDALKLAGLHGRSDVKAKVYKKYPELKNKKATLGTFGSLTGANRRLLALTQNVPSAGITTGAKIINPSASSIKPMNLSSNNGSKGFNLFKGIDKGEAISSGIGALGNIISAVTNKNSINNIQAPTRPRTIIPVRMRTTYNINPQLAESRNSERNMARIIDSNTSSSSGKIARIQSLANRGVLERNKLRGIKENVETYLFNRSALNRQGVEAANNQVLNAYDNAVTQTENEKIQARANNRTNIIEGLTSAVRDYQLGMDKRRSEENATAAMMSANPEQMELFLKLMNKNKGRLSNIRSTLFKCGGKKKIA